MMKLSVRVRGDWFAVPCKGPEKVLWLGEETLRRYYKSKGSAGYAEEKVYEVRKAKGGAILDPDDAIKDVLDDDDFVTVVMDSDMSSPIAAPAEITYVEEKVSGSSIKVPTEHISLDGNSLAADDLVRLGKGEFLIKLTVEAEQKVQKARDVVDEILATDKVVYGVTTGFGKFARTTIDKEKLVLLFQ